MALVGLSGVSALSAYRSLFLQSQERPQSPDSSRRHGEKRPVRKKEAASGKCLEAGGKRLKGASRGPSAVKKRRRPKEVSPLRKRGKSRRALEEEEGAPKGGEGDVEEAPLPSVPLRRLLEDVGRLPDSRHRASRLFEWVIAPIPPQRFWGRFWEKEPLLVRRHDRGYYGGLFSTSELDALLRRREVLFGVNLDVTSYEDGKRETHNPVGRALPPVVWDFFRQGCSLRLLNPQAFSGTVWRFLSLLQEHFGCMVGANTYLTPAGTQGFAPHYDDIEAFVLQLEGKKRWRVYGPRKEAEVLPRFSSGNFTQEEIGEPILETVLEAGDLLYFPRGFIHQGDCLPDAHSLHITVSSYQRNTWGDLLEKLLPAALQMALEEDVEYRQGLPLDYLEYMGVLNSDSPDPRRGAFMQKVSRLITKLMDYAPVDAVVDQKAKEFLHDCLPPVLTESEKALSIYGHPARWENGNVHSVDVQVKGTTLIRLLRCGIVRLCNEGDSMMLYYTTENSRVYHKEDPKYFEIEPEYAESIEFLLSSYPEYVSVEALPCTTLDDKIALTTVLFEKGLLVTKDPLLFL